MPKRQPPKNSTWVQLTKDFVKEWPEVLDGLQFQNMPVKYLQYIRIILKNNITIHYDIAKELKIKKQDVIARFLRQTLEANYRKIKNVDINFDVPKSEHTYLHRIGRSGRWGRKGIAINFTCKHDISRLKKFEEYYQTQIVEMPNNYTEHLNL